MREKKFSINIYKLNISRKAKLRIESPTRWSSSFLILEAFQRASNKGAVSSEKQCPIALDVIEKYMQILQPAFEFNACMQYTKSAIGIVAPNVLILISKWQRMQVTSSYRKLCDLLILGYKRKFDHELNSPVYSVASLLCVSNWEVWLNKGFSVSMRKQAFENIVEVANGFFIKNAPKADEISSTPTSNTGSLSKSSSSGSVGSVNFENNESYDSESELTGVSMQINLEKEREGFVRLVENANIKDKRFVSNSKFWLANKQKFPLLFDLALILYNIPASSAFIERFYSLSGNVCKNRNGNMDPETIIARSMLKANIEILQALNKTQLIIENEEEV